MDLPGRALLPGLRITYDLAFDRKCEASHLRSSIAVVSTWSPISSSHCVISLLVARIMLELSYASDTKLKNRFAWFFVEYCALHVASVSHFPYHLAR